MATLIYFLLFFLFFPALIYFITYYLFTLNPSPVVKLLRVIFSILSIIATAILYIFVFELKFMTNYQ